MASRIKKKNASVILVLHSKPAAWETRELAIPLGTQVIDNQGPVVGMPPWLQGGWNGATIILCKGWMMGRADGTTDLGGNYKGSGSFHLVTSFHRGRFMGPRMIVVISSRRDTMHGIRRAKGSPHVTKDKVIGKTQIRYDPMPPIIFREQASRLRRQ
eukprot:scaffold3347_cov167-Amphora_coffeaeformis.AAC.2